MITAVDTSVLIDIFAADQRFGAASANALRVCLNEGTVVESDVVWSETRAQNIPADGMKCSSLQVPKPRRSCTRDVGGKLLSMKPISVAEILGLPVQERIRLVELIWESIAAVPESVEVTPELMVELEARLKEFEADPEGGYSWEQVRSHLRDGTWRSA